jgi:hypothetical protein
MPGFFIVPQNPLTSASMIPTGSIAAALADEETRAGYVPRIGELIEASFTVPQNPLVQRLSGGGCGCGGCGCQSCSMSGLGVLGLPDTIAGLPAGYVLIGAGALLLLMLGSSRGSAYRREMKEAREKYRKELARIRESHPRLGARVRRSARAAREAF